VSGHFDHYCVLGVAENASFEHIRAAYRDLARRNHPDRVSDPEERDLAAERMATVNEAWRVLGDPVRREAYDLDRKPLNSAAAPPGGSSDDRVHGRRGDAFDDVIVSPAAGCALRVAPVALTVLLLLGILIATAVLGGGGEVPPRMDVGRCVKVASTVQVVPCTVDTPVIVGRGVTGTTCPVDAIAVVLPSRTEQVCLAPPGTPTP